MYQVAEGYYEIALIHAYFIHMPLRSSILRETKLCRDHAFKKCKGLDTQTIVTPPKTNMSPKKGLFQ